MAFTDTRPASVLLARLFQTRTGKALRWGCAEDELDSLHWNPVPGSGPADTASRRATGEVNAGTGAVLVRRQR